MVKTSLCALVFQIYAGAQRTTAKVLRCRRSDVVLGNHVLQLGSDIGFFEYLGNDLYQDVFKVVWDRSIDKTSVT